MRAHDWAATPLGPVSGWASNLEAGAGPPAHVALRDVAGLGRGRRVLLQRRLSPHPRQQASAGALGMPGSARSTPRSGTASRDASAEGVPARARPRGDRALLLLLNRRGYLEETYHTFWYSPLRGDGGRVEGIFCAVTEETGARHQRAPARVAGRARRRAGGRRRRGRGAARRGARAGRATRATCRSPSPTCSTPTAPRTWPA